MWSDANHVHLWQQQQQQQKWKPMFESQKLHDWSFLAIKTQFS